VGRQELIHIEPMQLQDLHEVRAIEKLSFVAPWSYRSFLAELSENENAHYLVAKQEQRVVGYVGLWLILDEGHITNIAVHPKLRGRGIGRRLLHAIAQLARRRGVRRMSLEVRVSNARAQKLYYSLGYQKAGIRPGYYLDNNEDAIIMWKDLDNEDHNEVDTGNRDQL